MALVAETEFYAVNKCQITAMLTDPRGGTATYGSTPVVIPGIKSVLITPQANVKDLTGDNTLLDSKSRVQTCEVKISFAKFSFNAMPLFMGGVVADSGTTPAQVKKYSWSYERGTYFKLEATVDGVDPVAGDLHMVIYKMNIQTPPPLSLIEQDFTTFEATGKCYKRLADGLALDLVMNETAIVLA